MTPLFSRHPLVLQTAFSEVKRQASEQSAVLLGTPGSVGVRDVNGSRFYYRQYYDAVGKKRAEYLGPIDDDAAEARATALRERIAVANELTKETRHLATRGYARVDVRTNAIVASFANHGLFRGGAVLVGSHSYGALLNELGVRAAAFTTEDVDLARGEKLDLAVGDGAAGDFTKILEASAVPLVPVPAMKRGAPSTSWKPPGADRLRVDLLTTARGTEITTRTIPELNAHAAALPHLAYLLEEPLETVLLGRESVVPLHVPRPEALAWHKMLLSQLRGTTNDKRGKDVEQAAVLTAVLAEDAEDALASSFAAIPRSARTATRAGAALVRRRLEASGHIRALDVLSTLRAI